MSILVDRKYYDDLVGVPVELDDFDMLSKRAEILCEKYVMTRIVKPLFLAFQMVATDSNDYKDAICLQIEMLYQSNGLQAVTGAGDAKPESMLEGVPFSSLAKHKIEMFLSKQNLIQR